MSSPVKDARWQIATTLAEQLGLNWAEMTWEQQSVFLSSAQAILEVIPNKIPELARKWNKD